MSFPRARPLGDAALSLELGDSLDAATNARVRALDRELARAPFEGFREAVPTHRSLLVLYDPSARRFDAVARDLTERASRRTLPAPPGRLHEVATVYGGEDGPDLEALARERALAPRDVVRLHAAAEYTAFMLGFTPGFAYLGLLPEPLACARRATPRVRVPAGSVGLAGARPASTPCPRRAAGRSWGGWRSGSSTRSDRSPP